MWTFPEVNGAEGFMYMWGASSDSAGVAAASRCDHACWRRGSSS